MRWNDDDDDDVRLVLEHLAVSYGAVLSSTLPFVAQTPTQSLSARHPRDGFW